MTYSDERTEGQDLRSLLHCGDETFFLNQIFIEIGKLYKLLMMTALKLTIAESYNYVKGIVKIFFPKPVQIPNKINRPETKQ